MFVWIRGRRSDGRAPAADGTGSLPPVVNADPATIDFYLQVFDITGGPLEASNGVRLPLVDLPL
jgi:hypothetical protein